MNKKEYAAKNREWLQEKSYEDDVMKLDRGVMYKVLKSGSVDCRTPDKGSVVTVHYTGRTINGHKFDSSHGGIAPAFRLRDLIPGWIVALEKMHIGDRWEIYIPAEQGYGRINQPDIPANSTLIFDIELLGIA